MLYFIKLKTQKSPRNQYKKIYFTAEKKAVKYRKRNKESLTVNPVRHIFMQTTEYRRKAMICPKSQSCTKSLFGAALKKHRFKMSGVFSVFLSSFSSFFSHCISRMSLCLSLQIQVRFQACSCSAPSVSLLLLLLS